MKKPEITEEQGLAEVVGEGRHVETLKTKTSVLPDKSARGSGPISLSESDTDGRPI